MTKYYLTVDNGAPYGRNRMTGGNRFNSQKDAAEAKATLEEIFGWDDIEIEESNDDAN